MMTVLPILISLCLIVTCVLLIAISMQRAFTRIATLRRELRAGGPFYAIHYAISESAWQLPSPLPTLRKRGERAPRTVVTASSAATQQDRAEAA